MQKIADRYDVTTDALRKALADHGRFAAVQEVRADLVWFATSDDAAKRWASRAPELRWEALWAVWWVTRDPHDPAPWRSPTAAAWHARQFFGSPPAVMEMEIPIRHVLGRTGEPLDLAALDMIRTEAEEVSIRPPGELSWIKGVQAVRRPVEFTAVAGLLDISTDDLGQAVRAGRVPEPRPPLRPIGDWTWFEDELAGFIPQELLVRTT
ncbi:MULTISPECIES: hypothetical protein [unclassified Nocardia]|uniref:hypothetical protein n=1 Tax=unclassified Nocardia TaxID=2637762 RepID=UPI00278C18C6|nr:MULTISPECIES: hypothetical protein [unclassified Nocardia]